MSAIFLPHYHDNISNAVFSLIYRVKLEFGRVVNHFFKANQGNYMHYKRSIE